jgi:excisionase family DNA binding protein
MSRLFLTTAELQLLTGISRAAIFAALRDGSLKCVKLQGRRRRIRVCDASEWLGHKIVLPRQS